MVWLLPCVDWLVDWFEELELVVAVELDPDVESALVLVMLIGLDTELELELAPEVDPDTEPDVVVVF